MSGLLDGMRVLDAGIWRPVPHATQMLADLGAEVLKLEPPAGDPMRAWPAIFRGVASHKRSVVVDLRTEEGKAHALALAAEADVFCEGWRPGVADRLGVGYDAVRAVQPAIVYCSVSGYGQGGPLAALAGHDVNYQALAGALARGPSDPRPPELSVLPVADLAAATVAATLICAAWAKRLQTGEGERIDVAMADVMASWRGPSSSTAIAGRKPRRGMPGYGIYRAADGAYLTLGCIGEDHFWRAICDGLALDAYRDLDGGTRLDRMEECDGAVRDAVAALARDDAVERLEAAGAPVAPLLTPEEMAAHPQFRARGVVTGPADAPEMGFPARLDAHPPRAPGAVPTPGEHDGWLPRA